MGTSETLIDAASAGELDQVTATLENVLDAARTVAWDPHTGVIHELAAQDLINLRAAIEHADDPSDNDDPHTRIHTLWPVFVFSYRLCGDDGDGDGRMHVQPDGPGRLGQRIARRFGRIPEGETAAAEAQRVLRDAVTSADNVICTVEPR